VGGEDKRVVDRAPDRIDVGRTGLYILFASITMFFGAIVSAMLVRRSTGNDWTSVPLPWLVWVNTAVLIASSIALWQDQRRAGILLGLAFVAGQCVAWSMIIRAAGPGNWFYWVFSVSHALHVLGGFIAFRFARFELARTYWHFLAGLWVILMILFVVMG